MPSAQTGPKNGTLVHQYRGAKTNPEDSPMDYFSILAVLSGTACMFYEVEDHVSDYWCLTIA